MKVTKAYIVLATTIFVATTYFLIKQLDLIGIATSFKNLGLYEEKPLQNKKAGCECPENRWLDCMPTVGATKSTKCTQECVDWSKENCPGFQGVAY